MNESEINELYLFLVRLHANAMSIGFKKIEPIIKIISLDPRLNEFFNGFWYCSKARFYKPIMAVKESSPAKFPHLFLSYAYGGDEWGNTPMQWVPNQQYLKK